VLSRKEIILVHSMGKVGSTSVLKALKGSRPSFGIFQTHFLDPQDIHNLWRTYPFASRPGHLVAGRILSHAVRNKKGRSKRWKIITLTRDPILRNIAAFFQNIDRYFPDFLHRYQTGKISDEQLLGYFLKQYDQTHVLNHWFDKNIRDVFGIDIFEYPFPKEKGYMIYHNEANSADLLLIKLEHLDKCHKAAFVEFLGIGDIRMKNANVGQEKQYKDIYKSFKEKIDLPEKYISKNYSARFVEHLYGSEELAFSRPLL